MPPAWVIKWSIVLHYYAAKPIGGPSAMRKRIRGESHVTRTAYESDATVRCGDADLGQAQHKKYPTSLTGGLGQRNTLKILQDIDLQWKSLVVPDNPLLASLF